MVIQHNIAALNAHRNLGLNGSATSKNLRKLSSGFRINQAADDAAGLAISEKMRGQINGLAMAEQNTAHGINLIQTAEGALNESHAILQRMRELAVQASNGTYVDEDRAQIDLEYDALKSELDRISHSSEYNAMKLFEDTVHTRVEIPQNQIQNVNYPWGPMLINDMYQQGIFTTMPPFNQPAEFEIDIQVAPDGELMTIEVLSQASNHFTVATSDQGSGYHSFLVTEKATGSYIEVLVKSSNFVDNFAGGVLLFRCSTTNSGANFFYQPRRAFMWEVEDVIPSFTFQIGANGAADQCITMQSRPVNAASLRINTTELATRPAANQAIGALENAIGEISTFRAYLGSLQNRMEHTLNNLGVTKENLTAAESTIRDVDMAKEMMEFTKNSILAQASQAMLAQANTLPQGALSLLH